MIIETLNQKNDFVTRTDILKSFKQHGNTVVISKTDDGKKCIDIISRGNIFAISLARTSELLKTHNRTVNLSEIHSNFPSAQQNPYVEVDEEFRRVGYDIQLSVDGNVSDKQTATAEVWFEYSSGYYEGYKEEREIQYGINYDEKELIGNKLTGTVKHLWDDYVPTMGDLKGKTLSQQEVLDRIAPLYNSSSPKHSNKDEGNTSEKQENTSEMVASKIAILREVVKPNISPEKGVVTPKMSSEQKHQKLNDVIAMLQQTKIKND